MLLGGLAMSGVTFRFGVVDDVLEPVSFGVNDGAFALVSHDPAPAARRGPGRILFSAPVTNHDWPVHCLVVSCKYQSVCRISQGRRRSMTWYQLVSWS